MRCKMMIPVAVVLAVSLLGGCGGKSYPTSPSNGGNGGGTGGGTPSQITISGFAFTALTVAAGTTVTWKNSDTVAHTATSDQGSAFHFDTGSISPGGTSGGIVFSQAGTFSYHCTFHPDMHGSITVQ